MKRLILGAVVFVVGSLLGAGTLYVALHWDRYNPFLTDAERAERANPLASLLARLRRSCAADKALRGAFVKSVQPSAGTLSLRGLVASKEQYAILESQVQAFLDSNSAAQAAYSAGVSLEGLKVLPIHDRLGQLQGDFDEGRGATAKTGPDPVRRAVMRATRLDASFFAEDGKLTFSAVCICDSATTATCGDVLKAVLEDRLADMGITQDIMPEIAVEVGHHANPAAKVQEKLTQDAGAKGVYLVSCWYDGKGRLHFEGVIAKDEQRKLIDAALDAFKNDPQVSAVVKPPAQADQPPEITARIVLFDGAAQARALQQKLFEYSRKDKAHLRRIWIDSIVPTLLTDEEEKANAKDEGKPRYFFRLTGRWLDSVDKAKRNELKAWLLKQDELPKILNSNQIPVLPTIDLTAQKCPIFALQERVVERGLDGAVFTDAVFDEQGRQELTGRMHIDTAQARLALLGIVKEVLPEGISFELKPHETRTENIPIAWNELVRKCQERLATGGALSERTRLDRLYFAYDADQSLRLRADGVMLRDGPQENPASVLPDIVKALIALPKGATFPAESGCKSVSNPLVALQDQAASRPDFDGALLTNVSYDGGGRLQFDGLLGQADHKALLTTLLTEYLEKNRDLIEKESDPKLMQGWSIERMKSPAVADAASKRSEILQHCQSALSSAADKHPFRRVCLERVFFNYREVDGQRLLSLNGKATHLTKPDEAIPDRALEDLLVPLCDEFLKDRKIAPRIKHRNPIERLNLPSPIFALQNQALAQKIDGIFFKDALYGADGKMVLTGIYGNPAQRKQIDALVEGLTSAKENRAMVPFGVASLDMRLIPWQALQADIRSHFAGGASSQETPTLFMHTHIKEADFKYVKTRATIFFHGTCIYYAKNLTAAARERALIAELEKQLHTKELDGFDIDLSQVVTAPNPVIELQKLAIERELDGVVFSIGFDKEGNCYVKVPFMPKGQEANVRKLVEELSKKHPRLGPIRLQ